MVYCVRMSNALPSKRDIARHVKDTLAKGGCTVRSVDFLGFNLIITTGGYKHAAQVEEILASAGYKFNRRYGAMDGIGDDAEHVVRSAYHV